MDTKMFLFDIDGTLITEEDGKMPDSTKCCPAFCDDITEKFD